MITYRQTTADDNPALSQILGSVSVGQGSPLLDTNHPISGWAAYVDGHPAGFALANGKAGELCVVAVVPEHRSKGIARELMRLAEAWLFSDGRKEIRLSMFRQYYESSVSFFKHLGWVDAHSDGMRIVMKKSSTSVRIQFEERAIMDSENCCH